MRTIVIWLSSSFLTSDYIHCIVNPGGSTVQSLLCELQVNPQESVDQHPVNSRTRITTTSPVYPWIVKRPYILPPPPRQIHSASFFCVSFLVALALGVCRLYLRTRDASDARRLNSQ